MPATSARPDEAPGLAKEEGASAKPEARPARPRTRPAAREARRPGEPREGQGGQGQGEGRAPSARRARDAGAAEPSARQRKAQKPESAGRPQARAGAGQVPRPASGAHPAPTPRPTPAVAPAPSTESRSDRRARRSRRTARRPRQRRAATARRRGSATRVGPPRGYRARGCPRCARCATTTSRSPTRSCSPPSRELDAADGGEPRPRRRPTRPPHERFRHLMGTDPGGCWVAVDDDDRPIGAALALVREGVWGLSLLVVRPDVQSVGRGRRAAARRRSRTAHGARGGIILASPTRGRCAPTTAPASPCTRPPWAAGTPAGTSSPTRRSCPSTPAATARWPRDRPHRPRRRTRRGPRGARRRRRELLALPGRGFAALRDGDVKLVAARDDEAAAPRSCARALARAARPGRGELAHGRPALGRRRRRSRPGWSSPSGARSSCAARPAPFSPYLPSGAYL